jgi:hypothetical protein
VQAGVLAAQASGETEYMAVFMDGKKIGYAEQTRTAAGKKVTTVEKMEITIGRAGVSITVKQSQTQVETEDGKPLSFSSVQDMGIMATKAEGAVFGGQVNMTVSTGGEAQKKTFPWPEGAVMAEGARLIALKKGMKEGTTYTITVFSAELQQAMDTEFTIGAKKQVDLLGRVVKLTEVKSIAKAPTGQLNVTGYVDDEQNVKKITTSMIGMTLEMVACGKEYALSKNDPTDFFAKVFISSPEPLGDLTKVKSITYTISPTTPEAKLEFAGADSQTVKKGESGSVIVTVAPVAAAGGEAFPYKGSDKAALAAMKPAKYLQSDAKPVIELSKKAVGDAKDSAQAAKNIEAFVGKYITKKDLSVGYASALEVVESKQGDCTEHAVLVAALCRAAGIPARGVVGMAYVEQFAGKKNIFGPHAWDQALVAGKWVDLDAALGYDAGHIALSCGDGDSSDFFGVINTLGCFKIDKVEVKK